MTKRIIRTAIALCLSAPLSLTGAVGTSAQTGAHPLNVQEMKQTSGAGYICNGNCNPNSYPTCQTQTSGPYAGTVRAYVPYNHLVCVSGSALVDSSCSNTTSLDCYDFNYYGTGSCAYGYSGIVTTTTHYVMCCGN